MSESSETQRRYREFLDLMPLTLALAGLPPSEPGKYFTEEQVESRLFTMRYAWRHARQLARECVQKQPAGTLLRLPRDFRATR